MPIHKDSIAVAYAPEERDAEVVSVDVETDVEGFARLFHG